MAFLMAVQQKHKIIQNKALSTFSHKHVTVFASLMLSTTVRSFLLPATNRPTAKVTAVHLQTNLGNLLIYTRVQIITALETLQHHI